MTLPLKSFPSVVHFAACLVVIPRCVTGSSAATAAFGVFVTPPGDICFGRRGRVITVGPLGGADHKCRRDSRDSALSCTSEPRHSGTDDLRDAALRDAAAQSLLPVLYPNSDGRAVEAEKALKRCLRALERDRRERQEGRNGCGSALTAGSTREEREAIRKRLSDLILGTAVMRLRHWYVLHQRRNGDACRESIIGAEPWIGHGEASDDPSDIRFGTIRSMVDLHAEYLQRRSDIESDESIVWPADPNRRISVAYSLPTFVARLLVDQYGIEAAEEIAGLANEPGPITLRRNSIKCPTDEALVHRLWKEGGIRAIPLRNLERKQDMDFGVSRLPPLPAPQGCIRLVPDDETGRTKRPKKSLWSLGTWQDGWFEVQDVGSQLIVDAAEAKCGELVVDYCAGNGGKTLALASRIWDGNATSSADSRYSASRIVAHDVVAARLKQIRGSLGRAGLCEGGKGGITMPCLAQVETTCNSYDIGCGMADVVLVDAPCSSLGVLRRRPGQRWALTEQTIYQELPELQFNILKNASVLVKKGGRLVYATCSICSAENENIVERFERMEGFDDEWERWVFLDNETKGNIGNHCRSLVPHVHDSDGFFISRWKRRC